MKSSMAAILIFLKNLPRGQHERMHGAIVVTSASANELQPNGQEAEFQGPDGSISTKLIFPPAVPHFYRPQRTCGQGNIFTPVCHSFCSHGGRGSASVHAGMPHPPRADPPGADIPREQTPPRSRHPPDQTPPKSRYPSLSRHPPGADPPGLDTPLGSRLQHTVYERPVRILLECILVRIEFHWQCRSTQ